MHWIMGRTHVWSSKLPDFKDFNYVTLAKKKEEKKDIYNNIMLLMFMQSNNEKMLHIT